MERARDFAPVLITGLLLTLVCSAANSPPTRGSLVPQLSASAMAPATSSFGPNALISVTRRATPDPPQGPNSEGPYASPAPTTAQVSSPRPAVTPRPIVAVAHTTADPLARLRWYVDPDSPAARQVRAWKSSNPTAAAEIAKIAGQPQADWFGDWSGDVSSAVAARVATIRAAGAMPVLVAYDIPQRDCGSYSSGGAGSAAAYEQWIRGFASGIGSSPSVVVLEPDALAGLDCLSGADQATRLALLRDAVSVLVAHRGVLVYLDAGNSAWHPASVIADRLRSASVAMAQGFALNVSNFFATDTEVVYGDTVSALVGGRHFIVDTSRNGLGPAPDDAWCNPPGRAIGIRPTASTGHALADAYLWIKPPGDSDGTCNGGLAAGTWWASYALGLAERAAY